MSRARAACIGIGLVASLAANAAASARPERHTLNVFAASSLAEAFTELGRLLERRHPGLVVRFNFAGSQQLAIQLDQGAAADVFASADERWMSFAEAHGKLAETPVRFARNRLVAIVPRTNPARIRRLEDLARGGVKLVLGAEAVPVGRYSRIVLANLGRQPGFGADFAARTLRNVVSEEENVKSVVGKVQLGEADAGLVYRSDVSPAVARFVHVLEIPEGANVVASYPIARVKDGAEPDAAQAFVSLVLSAEGRGILERRGLLAPEEQKP